METLIFKNVNSLLIFLCITNSFFNDNGFIILLSQLKFIFLKIRNCIILITLFLSALGDIGHKQFCFEATQHNFCAFMATTRAYFTIVID